MFFATVRNNLAALCLAAAAILLTFFGTSVAARTFCVCLIAYSALLVVMGNQTLMAVRYLEKIQVRFTERATQYGIRCLYDPRYEDVIPDTASYTMHILAMAIFPILDFFSTLLNKCFNTQRFGQLHDIEMLDEPIVAPKSDISSRG